MALNKYDLKRGHIYPTLSVNRLNVFGLKTLLAFDHGEFHLLAIFQGTVTVTADGSEMHKHIFASLALNETKTLGIVKPLHGALFTIRHGKTSHTTLL
jgi:hypothetical protein